MEKKLRDAMIVTESKTFDHKLSIVIIGRNEADSIGRCIEAALSAASQIGGAEIIYVDSNSSDETVCIANRYGVKVIPLSHELRKSPSAGRYMGSLNARGELILFLDADTIVCQDFLPKAIDHLEADYSIGGINGFIDDLDESGELIFDIDERFDTITEVKWLRGPACLYRREAIIQAGSFNPELAIEEEAELGLRVLRCGWKLMIIPQLMACHTRCYHGRSIRSIISTFKRDIRSKRLGEITRTIRWAFRSSNGFAFCWLRLKTTILFLVWLMAILIGTLLPTSFYPMIVVTITILLGGLMVFGKKRSVTQTFVFVLAKIINLLDLIIGLPHIVMTSKPVRESNNNSYPLLVKESSHIPEQPVTCK